MAAGEGMSTVSEVHEEKETLSVDVEIPGHAPRGALTPHPRRATVTYGKHLCAS